MKKLFSLLAVLAIFALSACSESSNSTRDDQAKTNDQLNAYQNAQPVPKFDWSQYRQTVIDVETAQVNGVATTTFMLNYAPDPIQSCPSIGFPVASTAQLTNPDQVTRDPYASGAVVVAQAEPNGVYTGTSTGTYVVCVSTAGVKYIVYWEGSVVTIGGPATWDYTKHQAVLSGDPTVTSTEKKK